MSDPKPVAVRDLVAILRGHVEMERAFGVADCPRYDPGAVEARAGAGKTRRPVPSPPAEPSERRARKDAALKALAASIHDCDHCPLHGTRHNLVFGEGNPDADLMFVGEAPGADEDAQGRPFVGRAGQLLTRIIEAIKLRREDVYIANVLKCRPPDNRTPLPAEMDSCGSTLARQIGIIEPKIIVALGAIATRYLLGTDQAISRLRGRFHESSGYLVMPTYHPAYLLRNAEAKRPVWEDMQKVRDELARLGPKKT